jgi:uncharacterized protein with FMN-binding domain
MAASGLKQTEQARIVNANTRATAYATATGPFKAELTSTAPSATANGTAVVGGSYADQTYTTSADATTGSISNSAAISYGPMPAGTVAGVNLEDSAGTPRYTWWGVFTTALTPNAGDLVSFAIGAMAFSLANTP